MNHTFLIKLNVHIINYIGIIKNLKLIKKKHD